MAEVAIVTVEPTSSAPPREVALGAALMFTLSGVTVAVLAYPVPKVTAWVSFPPPKWRSETVCTSLIGAWFEETYAVISC